MKQEPFRMCIGCRQKKPKTELIKIVKMPNGVIEVDVTGKKNGRSAYICAQDVCHKKLHKQKLLNKTFSMFIDDSIYKEIEDVYNKLKQNV